VIGGELESAVLLEPAGELLAVVRVDLLGDPIRAIPRSSILWLAAHHDSATFSGVPSESAVTKTVNAPQQAFDVHDLLLGTGHPGRCGVYRHLLPATLRL
jgi:hypothetical protein